MRFNDMKTKEIIRYHNECLRLLEAVRCFEMRIESREEDIKGFIGNYFPALKKKMLHDIEIWKMCIERLNKKLNKLHLYYENR